MHFRFRVSPGHEKVHLPKSFTAKQLYVLFAQYNLSGPYLSLFVKPVKQLESGVLDSKPGPSSGPSPWVKPPPFFTQLGQVWAPATRWSDPAMEATCRDAHVCRAPPI
uniref:Uncharacterized protein n=1 Tax=Knipowitschia caucasica TaxID=637954 RepID=A0AAV2J3B1_KNICA